MIEKSKSIRLSGVRQNNLKGIDAEIPLHSFTVICGPSGSGKSSLAFETLYAEGQRRYIESLSNYSKQFLNKAPKPDVESIENIPPAISIEQKNSVKSSRSTVGTTTELVDYLRLFYEKAGQAFCPHHHVSLERHSPSAAAEKALKAFNGSRGYILSPVFVDGRAYKDKALYAELLKDGFARIYIPQDTTVQAAKPVAKTKGRKRKGKKSENSAPPTIDIASLNWTTGNIFSVGPVGEIRELSDPLFIKKSLPTTLFYIVIDRTAFASKDQDRLADSLAQAYHASLKYNTSLTSSEAVVLTTEGKKLVLSESNSCTVCNYQFPPITSAMFSFNSPVGACPDCKGFGNILEIDEAKVIPNPKLSLREGAITPFAMPSGASDKKALKSFCQKQKIDMDSPWEDLPADQRKMIWNGHDPFWGVKGLFEYLETKKYKMHVRVFLSRYKSPMLCTKCRGTRLKPEADQVLIDGKSITQLCQLPIETLATWMKSIALTPQQTTVCAEPVRQIRSRLQYLQDVGVGYLTLDRPTKTLSGGEFQRLILANQLGLGLSQTLYVLDEPTVGLHPRDNDRLIEILKGIRDLGNTLVLVEHDRDIILNASHVIEMGPGSGSLGGEVIFSGTFQDFWKSPNSNTVPYLSGAIQWTPPTETRPVEMDQYKYRLELRGCTGHNLKNVDVNFPLNRLVTVTGVSGSGKSTLVTHTLYPAIARKLGIEFLPGQPYESFTGDQYIKDVVLIDQSSIGKTARSSPVTYLKVYDDIRSLMASTQEARALGYTPGTFSLNVDGGRCPVCKGLGYETVDMLFMDDIEIPCEECDGKRFRSDVLTVTYKGKNIDEILNLTVNEAMDFFVAYPNIRRPLLILKEVGLEYIRLGQSANSLSGGESQRLKIARELYETQQKATLYIMDEPTTGLHFREVHLLIKVLNKLVESGASVILIEHNLEVIRASDFIIDVGPEAGERGGQIVAMGSPTEVAEVRDSHTGRYLKAYLDGEGLPPLAQPKPKNRTGKTRSVLSGMES